MNKIDCVICGKEFEYRDTYGGSECSHCGQKYEYDERQCLELTSRQISALKNLDALERDASRYKKLRIKHWSEGGIGVLENIDDARLGSMTLTFERLDNALDTDA